MHKCEGDCGEYKAGDVLLEAVLIEPLDHRLASRDGRIPFAMRNMGERYHFTAEEYAAFKAAQTVRP